MPGPQSNFEQLARDAARNVKLAHEAGEQLNLLPDEVAPSDDERARRGKGKVTSQLREFLKVRGFRLPEDVLAEMAGLATSQDAFLAAMARTEQILAWAQAGATGYKGAPVAPSTAQRLATFQFVFTAQLRAAEALLPYGLGKVTPDAATLPVVPIMVPVAPQQAIDPAMSARDVTPQPVRIGGRMMPANLRREMQQNQQVADAVPAQSDAVSRTDEANR